MHVTLIDRSLGSQTFQATEADRVYHVVYDVRGDWWQVTAKGRALAEFGPTYRQVVGACEPFAERAE